MVLWCQLSNFVFETKDVKSNLKMIDFGLSKHFLVLDDSEEASSDKNNSATTESAEEANEVTGDDPLPRRRVTSAGHATFKRMTTFAGTLA